MTTHLTKLHEFLINYFSLDELETLAFELNIVFQNLNGRSRKNKARNLILEMGNAERFDKLFAQLEISRRRAFEQEKFDTSQEALQVYYEELNTFEAETQPFTEKILNNISREQKIGFALVIIIFIIGTIAGTSLLYFSLRDEGPERMTGDFNIAVAPFQVIGADAQRGEDVANSVYGRLKANFDELNEPIIHVWGPEDPTQNPVPPIHGETVEERAATAKQLAQDINADIVVYGTVDVSSGNWQVTPEFFVSAQHFQEASEVLGQHHIGGPIEILGDDPGALRINAADEMRPRSEGLARLAVGLTYYAVTKYDRALEEFQLLEESGFLTDDTGADVVYLMLGNTLGKQASIYLQESATLTPDKMEEVTSLLTAAIDNYDKAIAIDHESARPYSGKGSAAYLLALGDGSNINEERLQASIEYLQEGFAAPVKPPYSQVEAKLHLNLGQSYLLQALIGEPDKTELAVEEFQQAITEYENFQGENDVLQELAAEAHARIGLIFACSDNPDEIEYAATSYQQAADLLVNRPNRQEIFQSNADKLKETGTLSYCKDLSE